MAKPILHSKPASPDRSFCLAIAAVVIMFCTIWILTDPSASFATFLSAEDLKDCPNVGPAAAAKQDPSGKTFYDDPETRYTLDKRINGWDEKRRNWLKLHPAYRAGAENRMFVLTGSQHSPCKNPAGDHLLLRFFKNKVDYCRIHGYGIFYNNQLLDPKMNSYWAKIPIVRAAMLAHPEVEWILWIDSDAIFTDMEFTIPFEKYKNYNLVIHGWPDMIEKKSWVSVNAGIFLMRNCQWSMDFMDAWAAMGPRSPDYDKWTQILMETLSDKAFRNSDDQSALVYLLLKEKRKWGSKIYVENRYDLHGYWVGIVDRFEELTRIYEEMDRKEAARLRRRHAEVVSDVYAAEREMSLDGVPQRLRRPFITHFTGCQPCSGEHNPEYKGDSCWVGMERALNFADNQVLRVYGFGHPDLGNGSYIRPLAFEKSRASLGGKI